jgi:hypothetical protein
VDGCRTPGNCSSGACEPCPETEGSDCSRCANPPSPADSFPAPSFPGYSGKLAVYDQVRVPKVSPGKYVVGFRYDCVSLAGLRTSPTIAFPCTPREPMVAMWRLAGRHGTGVVQLRGYASARPHPPLVLLFPTLDFSVVHFVTSSSAHPQLWRMDLADRHCHQVMIHSVILAGMCIGHMYRLEMLINVDI